MIVVTWWCSRVWGAATATHLVEHGAKSDSGRYEPGAGSKALQQQLGEQSEFVQLM